MIKHLKESLTDYLHYLTIYDYVAFGWLYALLFVLIIFAIVIRKRTKTAISLILLSVALMMIAPIAIKLFLDHTIRKTSIVDQNHTALTYAKSLVITGQVHNEGKISLQKCYIHANVLRYSDNKYKNWLNYLKPIRKQTIVLDKNLTQNESREFKMVLEAFEYDKEYNVTLRSECY